MYRETSTLLEGVGEGLFIQALPSIMLQNLFQIFWAGLSLKFILRDYLQFSKLKNFSWEGEQIISIFLSQYTVLCSDLKKIWDLIQQKKANSL